MQPKIYKAVQIPYPGMRPEKRKAQHFVISANGKFIIYVPRKGICALVNKEFVQKINSSDHTVKHFFNYIKSAKAIPNLRQSSKINTVSLSLTTDCNMECKYCYARGGEKPLYMSWEVAKAALDWAIENSGKRLLLSFFGGGEPTLAFPMIKKCWNYTKELCKSKGKQLEGYISTNGIMSHEQVKWLADTKIIIQLSLDGPPSIQNKRRPLKGRRPSYPHVRRTVKLLNKYNANYHVSVTADSESVLKMPAIVKHLHYLGVRHFVIRPVTECGRCHLTKTKAPDEKIFIRQLIKCYEMSKKLGMQIDDFYRMLYLLRNSCSASSPGFIVVTTDGYISSCAEIFLSSLPYASILVYGKIEGNKVKIDSKKLNYLKSRKVYNMSHCKNCFAKWSCAGECPVFALYEGNKSIFIPNSKLCYHSKQKMLYILNSILA